MKELKEFKIGGKMRPMKFGVNQSVLLANLREISITKMEELLSSLADDDGSLIRDLIWSALKDGARMSGTEFKYTNYDIGDWLDDIDADLIISVLEYMMGDKMPLLKDEGTKKKVIKK